MTKHDISANLLDTTINLESEEKSSFYLELDKLEREVQRVGEAFSLCLTKSKIVGLSQESFSGSLLEVSLELVSNETIQNLNNKFRNKDKVTDVLSFPVHNSLRFPGGYNHGPTILLGDIFIGEDIAIKQAAEAKITPMIEIIELYIHGLLHLLGFDHEISGEEKKIMYDLENLIFNQYKELK